MQRSLDLREEAEFFYNERSPYTGNRKILRVPQSDPRTGLVATVWPVGAAVIRLPSFAVADIAAHAASLLWTSRSQGRRPASLPVSAGAVQLRARERGSPPARRARCAGRSRAIDGAVIAAATSGSPPQSSTTSPSSRRWRMRCRLASACCLVALVLRTREREEVTMGRFALLGCLCGLLTITRYQDAAYFAAVDPGVRSVAQCFFGAIAGAAPVVAVQLLANRIWYGSMWTTGYEGVVRAEWLAPDVRRHLFAPLYGVFTTHPMHSAARARGARVDLSHSQTAGSCPLCDFRDRALRGSGVDTGRPGHVVWESDADQPTPAFALGWYGLRNRFPNLQPVGIALVCANITLLALYCLRVINPS